MDENENALAGEPQGLTIALQTSFDVKVDANLTSIDRHGGSIVVMGYNWWLVCRYTYFLDNKHAFIIKEELGYPTAILLPFR